MLRFIFSFFIAHVLQKGNMNSSTERRRKWSCKKILREASAISESPVLKVTFCTKTKNEKCPVQKCVRRKILETTGGNAWNNSNLQNCPAVISNLYSGMHFTISNCKRERESEKYLHSASESDFSIWQTVYRNCHSGCFSLHLLLVQTFVLQRFSALQLFWMNVWNVRLINVKFPYHL